jgi:hypothetical protein
MNQHERNEFVNSYLNNVANVTKDQLENFLDIYFKDQDMDSVMVGSEYTSIMDALGMWKDGKNFQKEISANKFVDNTFTENTGGGFMVDFIQLKDGRCIGISEECLVVYPSFNFFQNEDVGSSNLPIIMFEPMLKDKHEPYCPSNQGHECKCLDVDYIADQALNSACLKIQEMLDVPTGDLAGQVFSGNNQVLQGLKHYVRQEIGVKINGR